MNECLICRVTSGESNALFEKSDSSHASLIPRKMTRQQKNYFLVSEFFIVQVQVSVEQPKSIKIMTLYHWKYIVAISLFELLTVEALVSRQVPRKVQGQKTIIHRRLPKDFLIDDEDVFVYDLQSRFFIDSSNSTSANYLDDLTPPPINWARDSILFSDNPATKRNNAAVDAWRLCRLYLPPVFTGTWSWRDTNITEKNPLGALYNMIVVRIPTMGIGLVYIKNLVDGHPLIMDFGQGAFEMSPIAVFAVLALILA